MAINAPTRWWLGETTQGKEPIEEERFLGFPGLEDIFRNVFPDRDPIEIFDYVQNQPEDFINDLQKKGWIEDTEAIIKFFVPEVTQEELQGFFGTTPVPEPSVELREAASFPITPRWATHTTALDLRFGYPEGYPREYFIEHVPLKDAAYVFGGSIKHLPAQIGASILQAIQGESGASVVNRDWADEWIAQANENLDQFVQKIAMEYHNSQFLLDVAQLSRNLAFSITTMGAGNLAALPLWLAPEPTGGTKVAAAATAGAVSGFVSFRMVTYQIVQEYLEFKDAEKRQQTGQGLTLEEENQLKTDFHDKAVKYGLWEAIPEGISNMLFSGILGGAFNSALTKVVGQSVAKQIGGSLITKFGTKAFGIYGEELLTETITQKGQAAIEVEAGLREGNITWAEAFREIAPQTFLLTTIMAGTGQIVVTGVGAIRKGTTRAKNVDKILDSLKNEISEENPLYEGIKQYIKAGIDVTSVEDLTEAHAEWTTFTGEIYRPVGVVLTESPHEGGLYAINIEGREGSVGAVKVFSQKDTLFVNRISIHEEGVLTRSLLIELDTQLTSMAQSQGKSYVKIAARPENIALFERAGYTQEGDTNVMRKAVSPEVTTVAMAEGETVTGEPMAEVPSGVTPVTEEVTGIKKALPPELQKLLDDFRRPRTTSEIDADIRAVIEGRQDSTVFKRTDFKPEDLAEVLDNLETEVGLEVEQVGDVIYIAKDKASLALAKKTIVVPKAQVGMPEAGVPPITPPTPPSGIVPPTGIPPTPTPGYVGKFPSTEDIIRDLTDETLGKKVARTPVIRQILSVIDKTKLANDPISQAKILQGRLRDMSEGFSDVATAHLQNLIAQGAKPQTTKEGIVTDKNIKPRDNAPQKDGKPSMHIHDIVEYAERYDMPDKNRAYFNELRKLSQQITTMLEQELTKHDIILRKMEGETDWVYLRRVVASVGDVESTRFTDWRAMQKPRTFETALAGAEAKKPVTYLNPEQEVTFQLQAAYNWIAKLRVNEILDALTTTVKARVPIKYTQALIDANKKRVIANKLLGIGYPSIIARAGRGEVIHPQTMASVAESFPNIASELSELVNRSAKAREFTTFKNRVSPELYGAIGNYNKAKNDYLGAKARAGPSIDEGVGIYLPGKIFTTQELGGKKVLGRDIMRNVEEQFGFRRPGANERVNQVMGKVGAVLRQTKAAIDLSVQGIQTLPALGIDVANLVKEPARAIRGVPAKPTTSWILGTIRGWQRLFDPNALRAWMDGADIKTAQLEMIEHGALLSRSEFAEATGILSRIPVIGKIYEVTGAAFTIGRNAAQTYLYIGERARALHGAKTVEEVSQRLDQLAKYSNLATGTFSSRGAGISETQQAVESWLFFSARLFRSVFSLISHAGERGYTGRMARDSIVGLIAGTMIMYTMLALALGQKPRLNPLPESAGGDGAKWLTIKVGPVYIGIGGTIHGLARLMATNWDALMNHPEDLISFSMDNPNVRFLRGKLGPPAAIITDFVTGHDFLGELTTDNFGSIAKVIWDWGIPIWVEGMIDTIKRDAAPWEVGAAAAAEFFGGRTIPETDWDIVRNLRQIYAEMDYDKRWEDLTEKDKDDLRRNHPDLAQIEESSKEHWAMTGTDVEKWIYTYTQTAVERRNAGLVRIAQALLDGQISKQYFDNQLKYYKYYYSGEKAVVWDAKQNLDPDSVKRIERWMEDNQHPLDKALDAYWEFRTDLIDKADLPIDWDDIQEQSDNYLKKLSTIERLHIEENLNAWILELPEPAQQVMLEREKGMEDGTWWDNYRGETGLGQWWLGGAGPSGTKAPGQWWLGK